MIEQSERPARRRVAAVCWRRHPVTRALEFLLVRTSAGDRWTFPKGGLEPEDATPGAGAQREAWEEAGVHGSVDPSPLADYTHLAHLPDGSSRAQRVEAWLLHVTTEGGPHEPGRNPTWFAPVAALAALAENQRIPAVADETRRVLAAAQARLDAVAGERAFQNETT